jgi:dihydroxyacetone kinase
MSNGRDKYGSLLLKVSSSTRIALIEGMVNVEIRSAVVDDTYGLYIMEGSVGGGRKIAGTAWLHKEKG